MVPWDARPLRVAGSPNENARTFEQSNFRMHLVSNVFGVQGGVAERLKAAVLKTATRKGRRFESCPLRQPVKSIRYLYRPAPKIALRLASAAESPS